MIIRMGFPCPPRLPARPRHPLHLCCVCLQIHGLAQHTQQLGGCRGPRSGDPRPLFGQHNMSELLAGLPDCDASDQVWSGTDLSEIEPPSKRKKTGKFSSENKGGVDDSRSNDDGLMPDDSHELGQPAPMELEPPFSGKESNEINSVEGSCEVHPVAGKCPVRHPKAVQLLSAFSSNSNCLDVNLRMEGHHPPPLLLWLSDTFSQPYHHPLAGTIFGNLKPENVLMMTDRLFCGQLSYIKKNNMDPFLVKSAPEAEDLFSHLLTGNPELRLEATEVICHPFSWSSEVKLLFLQEMSARLREKNPVPDPDLLTELKRNPLVFYGKWIDKLDPIFKTYILRRQENYNFSSVVELVRFMRNKSVHLNEFPEEIKEQVGKDEEAFYNYFASRFPSLFMKFYGAAFQFCREEEWFKIFHKKIFRWYFGSDAL